MESLLHQVDEIMLRETQDWLMLMRYVEIKAIIRDITQGGPSKPLRQIELPLGVGALRERFGRWNAEVCKQGAYMFCRGLCPAGVARHVDDQVTFAEIVGQLLQQRKAALVEVFLYLDFVGLTLERAQLVGELETI
jgi:hypothetical protein